MINPFLFFRLARVESWLNVDGFIPYPLNVTVFDAQRPLYEMALAGIRLATGLSPLQVAALPIGAITLPVACYVLSHLLLQDRVVAFLLAAALLLNHAFAEVHLGTFVYVWSDLMLITFLVVLWRVTSEGRSPLRIATLACLFFVTEWIYPTTATWMIFLLGAHAGVAWLRRRRVNSKNIVGLTALTFACVAYFVYFDRVFSAGFLAALGRSGAESQLVRTIDELIAQFTLGFSGVPTVSDPYQVVRASSTIAKFVVITQYGLLALAVVVAGGVSIRNRLRRLPTLWSDRFVILVALVVGAAAHTATYSLAGHFSLRAFGLLGGVIGAVALFDVGVRNRFIRVWALGLAVVSMIGLAAFFATVPTSPSPTATRAAATWLLTQQSEPVVTADLGLYGRMLLTAASEGRTIQLAALDSCGFAHLVEASPVCGPAQLGRYVVIDLGNLNEPLLADGWRAFGPPSVYWAQILENPAQSVAYEQDGIVILRRLIDEP